MAMLTDDCIIDLSSDGTLNFWNIKTKQHILTKFLDRALRRGSCPNLIVLANGVIIVEFYNFVKIMKINFIDNNKVNCCDIAESNIGKNKHYLVGLSNYQVVSTMWRTDNDSLYLWN